MDAPDKFRKLSGAAVSPEYRFFCPQERPPEFPDRYFLNSHALSVVSPFSSYPPSIRTDPAYSVVAVE